MLFLPCRRIQSGGFVVVLDVPEIPLQCRLARGVLSLPRFFWGRSRKGRAILS
jgi:hypothetical protein